MYERHERRERKPVIFNKKGLLNSILVKWEFKCHM